MIAVTATPAVAECLPIAPNSGDIVTCDTNQANPETDGIVAPGAQNVTVNILTGAELEVTGGPAINLGGGAAVSMEFGATIKTLGDSAAGILINDGVGGATATFSASGSALETSGNNSTVLDVNFAGTSSISASAENTSFATVGDGSGVLNFILGDTGDVLVFLEESSLTSQGANASLLEVSLGAGAASTFVALGTMFESRGDGSAGIVYRVTNGGDDIADDIFLGNVVVETAGAGAAALLVEQGSDNSTRDITIEQNGSFSTVGDDSAGIFIGGLGDFSALSGTMADTTVSTLGNNSNAIEYGGVGASSVSSYDIANATVSTEGDASAGVRIDALIGQASLSTTTTSMANIAVTTLGADSSGIRVGDPNVDLGGPANINTSSRSHEFTNLIISTAGDRSLGLALYGFGDGNANSDSLLAIVDSEIATQGNDATGVLLDLFSDGLTDSDNTLVISGLTIGTAGDGANGLIIGDNEGANTGISDSNVQVFLNEVAVTTSGDESIGLIVEPIGFGASDSNFITTLQAITVATSGINSHGIILGEGLGADMSGSGVTNMLTLTDISSTTTGDGASALVLHGHTLVAPSASSFAASGANAHGVLGLLDAGETTAFTIAGGTTVEATGAGGSGMRFESSGDGAFATVIVTAGHGVSGSDMAMVFDTAAGDVTVAGSVTGGSGVAVQFASTDDRFLLQAGGTVAGTIEGGLGTDSFLFGGTGVASFNVAQINDFEDFLKTGNATWTLTGANVATATFLVDQGTLVNDSTLTNMAMTVASGARLEGVGAVGGLIVNGAVAPGISIGMINVAGNVVLNSGSTYEIEIEAPNLSDLISATGTATINGGDLAITALDTGTSYADSQTYRIIEADGGVIRNADFTHNQPVSLIRTEVVYGTDFVDLLLIADIPFTTLAETYNQFQAATGLQDMEQGGDALTVYNEIVQLSLQPDGADAARRAFDLSSGEVHASGQQLIDQTFALFSRTLRGQASAGLGGMAGGQVFTAPLAYDHAMPSGPGVVAIDDATASTYASERVANAWLAPLGGRGTVDADGNAGALDWWTAGLAGGYEGPIDVASGNAWAGFGFGYMRSHGAVDARLSTFDADNFQIGAHGGWADGPWALAASLAYGASHIDTERRIVFGGIDRTAEADYWSHTVGFSGEAAYGFNIATGTTLSPLFTLDAGWSGHGGFTETGAGALNLIGASESWTRLDTGLGIALQHVILTESGKVTLNGRAVWEHAFADVVPSQSLAFADSPTGFEGLGPDAGRDRFRLSAGVSFEATKDLTISASYSGLFSGNQQNHAASVGLNVKF